MIVTTEEFNSLTGKDFTARLTLFRMREELKKPS